MKTSLYSLRKLYAGALGLLVLWAVHPLSAQPEKSDPLAEHLFSPDLIKQAHALLDLTEDQQTKLQIQFEQMQDQMGYLKNQHRKAAEALADLVKPDRLQEDAVLAQAHKLLNLESDMKHAEFTLLVRIKNILTPAQQAKLQEIKRQHAALQPKLKRVHELARQWQQEGRDMAVLESFKQEFETVMRQAQWTEAEAVVDRVIRRLEEKESPRAPLPR